MQINDSTFIEKYRVSLVVEPITTLSPDVVETRLEPKLVNRSCLANYG